jgi:hypothetical protein
MCVSDPYGVDMSGPEQNPFVQTGTGAAQAPIYGVDMSRPEQNPFCPAATGAAPVPRYV